MPTSPKEKEFIDWINLIVDKGLPIGIVEDDLCRKFRGPEIKMCRKSSRNTVFVMIDMVEKVIGVEMKKGRGNIPHDGWTKCYTHHAWSCACCTRKKG